MPKEFNRTQRMSEHLQRELAQLIQQDIKDPRAGIVTVSEVELSRDFRHAKVYVTVLGGDHDSSLSVKILNEAAGFLRHELARRTEFRTVPQLRFVYDATVECGVALSALIDAAVAEDKRHDKENE